MLPNLLWFMFLKDMWHQSLQHYRPRHVSGQNATAELPSNRQNIWMQVFTVSGALAGCRCVSKPCMDNKCSGKTLHTVQQFWTWHFDHSSISTCLLPMTINWQQPACTDDKLLTSNKLASFHLFFFFHWHFFNLGKGWSNLFSLLASLLPKAPLNFLWLWWMGPKSSLATSCLKESYFY